MADKKNITDDPLSTVRQFYDFMKNQNLEVVEYSKEDTYIKLVRKHVPAPQPVHIIPSREYAAAEKAGSETRQPLRKEKSHDEGDCVRAPLAGIFYRAPSPSSPPYVRDGDSVKEGQVICVIEAMKVFNELKAEYDCVIRKVAVDNGTPVDTNDVLFIVERA